MNHIESVLFPVDKFTEKEAEEWLKTHSYKHSKIDITDKFLRFRQIEPIKDAKFVVKKLKNGVELILEYNKPEITIQKSDDKKHKYQAVIQEGDKTKIVRFGGVKQDGEPYEDYTSHHDKDRMARYTTRHIKEKEFWSYEYENIFRPSFWSKNLLWNNSDIKKASEIISKSLGYSVTLDI